MQGKWLISLILITLTFINAQEELPNSELKFLSEPQPLQSLDFYDPDESQDIYYTAEEIIIRKR